MDRIQCKRNNDRVVRPTPLFFNKLMLMAVELKSNSFGTLIANVIPGFFLLHALAYYIPTLQAAFTSFLNAESSIGLFFLMTFLAIALGLLVGSLRSYIFEGLIYHQEASDEEDDETSDETDDDKSNELNDSKVVFLRMVVDEQYRYHQFYGSILLVQPFYFYTIAGDVVPHKYVWILALLVISLTGYATHSSYQRMLAYLDKLKY